MIETHNVRVGVIIRRWRAGGDSNLRCSTGGGGGVSGLRRACASARTSRVGLGCCIFLFLLLQLMTVGLLVPLVFAIGTLCLAVALAELALPGLSEESSGVAFRLNDTMMLLGEDLVHDELATDVGSM